MLYNALQRMALTENVIPYQILLKNKQKVKHWKERKHNIL